MLKINSNLFRKQYLLSYNNFFKQKKNYKNVLRNFYNIRKKLGSVLEGFDIFDFFIFIDLADIFLNTKIINEYNITIILKKEDNKMKDGLFSTFMDDLNESFPYCRFNLNILNSNSFSFYFKVLKNIKESVLKNLSLKLYFKTLTELIQKQNSSFYGFRITLRGRLLNQERATSETFQYGSVRFSTISRKVIFFPLFLKTEDGILSISIWFCLK